MKAYIAAVAGIIIASVSTAKAAEPREPKPVVCSAYSIAKLADGSSIGICEPTKAGGKPRVLRAYSEVTVGASRLLVGYP